MKRLLMIAAAVAVLGLAAVAVGGAATSADEGDGPIGTFLSKVADKLGVTEDELKTAIDEAQTETLDEAVAEGRLTEGQAERLRERAEERLREHVEEGGILFPPRPLPGRFGHNGCGQVMDAAAEVLGMPKDELMEQLSDGNSLAEVAEAQKMSVEDFKAALLDQVKAQLDELVAEGDLTQEQADEIFQNVNENIDSIVNAERGLGGFGGPRRGPGGFGGPWHGPLGEEPEATESSEVTA